MTMLVTLKMRKMRKVMKIMLSLLCWTLAKKGLYRRNYNGGYLGAYTRGLYKRLIQAGYTRGLYRRAIKRGLYRGLRSRHLSVAMAA